MQAEATGEAGEAFLKHMARPGCQEVEVAGQILRPGSRVRLKPRPRGDVLDAVLADRIAIIEGIDEDQSGTVHVAVIIEDDAARDLAGTRHPARRFFFAASELEPMEAREITPQRRVLVAGIGNIFFGDDGFGVAVAQNLLGRTLPAEIEVGDFGIRGMDLAYSLGRGYHAAILVDAVCRGRHPGTIQVILPEDDEGEGAPLDGHRMNPVALLGLARRLGQVPEHILIVGCEPREIGDGWSPALAMNLSDPVAAAVEQAADMVMILAEQLAAGQDPEAAATHLKGV